MLLIGSGGVAAAQKGKAVITVPVIRSDLELGFGFAGYRDDLRDVHPELFEAR